MITNVSRTTDGAFTFMSLHSDSFVVSGMLLLKGDTVSPSIVCYEKPMRRISLNKEFISFLRRLVSTQPLLLVIVKVKVGNSGVTVTSAQSFGGVRFSLTLLEF
ncbi:hypothetical protein V6N13_074395 [Hibiscus sabdariffa]|uniref:Uncharacterized protein n=1 Tax=Hibiscus sabdariffa TaxID=183260 RepID=A0ABR2U8E3_9ROSI